MKSILRLLDIMTVLVLIALFLTACGVGGGNGGDENGGDEMPEGDISMITPYVNESDMACIYNAFSSDDSAPWGFEHKGIDFSPNGDLKPFQAVFGGTVDSLTLFENTRTGTWQVNVSIKYNNEFSANYALEPFSTNQSDGQTQLTNVLVAEGQEVSTGQVIARLYITNSNAHVHFALLQSNVMICPEPYFTPEARDSILNLIRIVWPGANMCY